MNTAPQAQERRFSKSYARELRGLHNYARIRVMGPAGRPTTVSVEADLYARMSMKAGGPVALHRIVQAAARSEERRQAYLQMDEKTRPSWSELLRIETRKRLQTSAA